MYKPQAACPLQVEAQPVLEACVMTRTCWDTCSKGTPACRKARSDQGLDVRQHISMMVTPCVPRRHAHLGTRLCNQCWNGLIWSNPNTVTMAADAKCPRSLWNSFSGTTVLPLKDLRQFNTDWVHSLVRDAIMLTDSNSIPRKEILCTGESFFSIEAEVPEHQVPVIAQLFLWLGHNEPVIKIVEDPDAHFL